MTNCAPSLPVRLIEFVDEFVLELLAVPEQPFRGVVTIMWDFVIVKVDKGATNFIGSLSEYLAVRSARLRHIRCQGELARFALCP